MRNKKRHLGFTLKEEQAFDKFVKRHPITIKKLKWSKPILEQLWRLAFDLGREFQFENTKRMLCPDCAVDSPVEDLSGSPVHRITLDLQLSRGVELSDSEPKTWRRLCAARGIYGLRPQPREPQSQS